MRLYIVDFKSKKLIKVKTVKVKPPEDQELNKVIRAFIKANVKG